MSAVDPGAAQEVAFFFDCEGEALLGVLHRPAINAPAAAASTGVVVIVGGPQYRAGSHRQFVHLARALAAAGHPVLRFDVRGMGDSTGNSRNFEQITPDIGGAIDALVLHAPSVQHVVLWGLCDAASAALLYLQERNDSRVKGLCLANPWVRSPATLARTHLKHYYTRRLVERDFWLKLLRGEVAMRALREVAAALRRASGPDCAPSNKGFQTRMLQGWQRHTGPTLLLLSGDDYTAKEFLEYATRNTAWVNALGRQDLTRQDLVGADHTLSNPKHRMAVETISQQWLTENSWGAPCP